MTKVLMKSPQPGHCLFAKVGSGTCRERCGQPLSYKLQCPARGGRWYLREVEA